MFVDDGALALAIIGIVAGSAILATLLPDSPLVAGLALALGCPSLLVMNTMRAAKESRKARIDGDQV
ncbi:hypothetical protein [Bradyrhizobium genosp. A]|uniref:hypothetical protein n=1 Tax=Bradyrhizobium genosp. A TaxID=83626 RepID=UPI003CF809EF